jgi:hypothetical protein
MRVQAFTGVDSEAIMNDIINDEDDYTQAEPDTQDKGYVIDAEQMFPPNGMPTQVMTAEALDATLVRVLSRSQEDQPKDDDTLQTYL